MPQLRAQTTPLPHDVDLTQILPSSSSALAWLRNGSGLVGAGQAWRIDIESRAEAPSNGRRFAEATQAWDILVKNCEIRDDLHREGTGLISFGSFSFVGDSPAGSVLIVPQVVVGRDDDGAWLTLIGPSDTDVFTTLDAEATTLLNAALKGDVEQFSDLPTPHITNADESANQYLTDVGRAKEAMAGGETVKVVLSRQLDIETAEDVDERSLVARLADSYPQCWTFAVDGLIGASPEMLARRVGHDFQIRVLAGSQSPHDPVPQLFDAKNSREHDLAVESVIASLAPLGGTVERGEPFALQLPNVTHIATDVVARPGFSANSLQIAAALHPTAALGGTPTASALDLIAQIEGADRDRYGAPVGWFGADGAGEWCVALRCLRMRSPRSATAFAGGGILVDSDAEVELAETEAKFAPILSAFGL